MDDTEYLDYRKVKEEKMLGGRRLAKRSIIGTRVSAPWQDGRFHTGQIQGGKTPSSGGHAVYKIQFDDGVTRYVNEHEIVAHGFRSINSVALKSGQRVYLTQNGREISGLIKIDQPANTDGSDEITIVHEISPYDKVDVVRRRDELRLMESRKSARLLDQDTDYQKVLEMHPEPKKRTVSQIIDVPVANKSRRSDEEMSTTDNDDDDDLSVDVANNDEDEEMDVMDERMAAMVLTSLSCSPASPQFPPNFSDLNRSPQSWPDSGLSSSFASSGVQSNKSGSPSPPPNHPFIFGSYTDEGIDEQDGDKPRTEGVKRRKSLSRVIFKCTWRGCSHISETESDIESHVRDTHLGPREFGESDDSDHEEEFYYSEIEVPIGGDVVKMARQRHSSSPAGTGASSVFLPDHDYQRMDHSYSYFARPEPSANINIPGHQTHQVKRSFSWQPNHSLTSFSPPKSYKSSTYSSSTSPKYTTKSAYHKKSRSDVKKCRKVYGMENRDLWCTQCKWKKACSRFHDGH